MKDWVLMKLNDLRERQEAGEQLPCPRCGRMSMKPEIHANALSLVADIYLCEACAAREAQEMTMKNPLPPADWACMRPGEPFMADNAISYLPTIEQQLPLLEQVFRTWLGDGCPSDFRAYRNRAMRECPGVTELWTEPFQVEYRAKDGTRALIRFRERNGAIQYSIDTFRA